LQLREKLLGLERERRLLVLLVELDDDVLDFVAPLQDVTASLFELPVQVDELLELHFNSLGIWL